jgi:hypothetical protein
MPAAIVFFSDKLTIPPQQGIRCDYAIQLRQGFSSEYFRPCGESTTLVIGKSDALATELFPINSVFGFKIVDDGELLPIDPSGEESEDELKVLIFHFRRV